jgi:hypothetical protein
MGTPAPTLTKVLDTLPADLHYLRPAILAIASQPEGDVESGDADIEPIVAALRTRLANMPPKDGDARFKSDRDAYTRWLSSVPNPNSRALGCLHAVSGVLMGTRARDVFAPAPPPSTSVTAITLTPPAGWSLSKEPAVVVLRTRGLTCLLQCLPADVVNLLRLQSKGVAARFAPGVYTLDPEFSSGPAHGAHTLARDPASMRLVSAGYLLDVPGGHVVVTAMPTTAKADLEAVIPDIEAMLATITVP